MLGLELTGDEAERVRYLEPPNLRARIARAAGDFFARLAAQAPLVLAFEDLHWADPLSLDLIEQLMPLTDHVPLMLLAIFRAQPQEPAWRFHEVASQTAAHRYTAMTLEPLDEPSARSLVANLLHIEDLPERVRALILRKAEGNPFFVEEVIRSLLDAHLVVHENGRWRATRQIEQIAVPDTLAGVIGARLDRLEAAPKRVAQTAAVVGREFERDLLADVYEDRPALEPALAELQQRELIRERPRQPVLGYSFKHALTHETAYASLLLSRRRELHRRVAGYYERTDPERADLIARHLLDAQEEARAVPYLVTAGTQAARAYATPVAIGHFRRALAILPNNGDISLARRAYEGLGEALMLAGEGPAAVENYQAMVRSAADRGDVPMQVSALNKIGNSLVYAGKFDEVERTLIEAERLAREYDDQAGLAEHYWVRCAMCNMTADFGGAVNYLSQAVRIGRDMSDPHQLAAGLTHMANTLGYMGKLDAMWQTAEEALQVAREIGDLQHQAELLGFSIALHALCLGDVAAARSAAEEGLAIAERIGAALAEMTCAYMVGSLAEAGGEYDTALMHYEQSRRAGRTMGMAMMEVIPLGGIVSTSRELGPLFRPQMEAYRQEMLALLADPAGAPAGGTAWPDLGFAALADGDLAHAREYFQSGLTTPTLMGILNRPRMLIGAGLVALAEQRADEAAEHLSEARACVAERGMRYLGPLVAFADGHLSAARGEVEVALDQLAQAESLAQELGLRPLVWQARAAAARLLSALGRSDDAEATRQAARAVVDDIASRLSEPATRASVVASALATIDGQAGATA